MNIIIAESDFPQFPDDRCADVCLLNEIVNSAAEEISAVRKCAGKDAEKVFGIGKLPVIKQMDFPTLQRFRNSM